jgi:hypothetical protein
VLIAFALDSSVQICAITVIGGEVLSPEPLRFKSFTFLSVAMASP